MTYVDAILHIADYPALAAAIAAQAPDAVSETGQIEGFSATPAVRNGAQALVYVRLTQVEAARWRGTPGVTVLAEADYAPGVADALYGALLADPQAALLYHAVYPRQPVNLPDGTVFILPERFGVLG
jgi:hypothetical protein